jgi:hypothetical protein
MDRENVVNTTDTSGNRSLLVLTEAGRILISEGGYVKRLDEEFRKDKQQDDIVRKSRDKTAVETKHLKASLKHYKLAFAISLIAIVISISSLIYSIYFRI